MAKYKHWAVLGVMIGMGVLLMIYQGTNKVNYHVDEHWSYGFANSYDRTFIGEDLFYRPIDSELFRRYVTVQVGEQFAYDKIYYHKSQDVHPPLYYYLMHTVSSFFPDQSSKWFGIGINIVCYVLALIVLFILAEYCLKSRTKALLVVALWAFSLSAINTVMFIRMYSLLTLISLWFVLGVFKFLEKKRPKEKHYLYLLWIALAVFLGGMTHYYFFIFAFFITALACLTLLIRRQWLDLAQYSALTIIGVVAVVVAYPPIIHHVQSGYRGEEAINGLKSLTVDVDYLTEILNSVIYLLAGIEASLSWVWLLVIVGVGCGLWVKYRPTISAKLWILAGGTLASAYLITVIAPRMGIYQDRYLFNLMPFLTILLIALFSGLLSLLAKRWVYAVMMIVMGLVLFHNSFIAESRYLFRDNRDFQRIIAGQHLIYITPEPFRVTEMALHYPYLKDVFMVHAWEHDGISYTDHILSFFETFQDDNVPLIVIVEKRFPFIFEASESQATLIERGYALVAIETDAITLYDIYRIVRLDG
jgi:hypothetical protein